MIKYRVSLGFATLPDAALAEFTGRVVAGLTGNAAFPTPDVPLATLQAQLVKFDDALAMSALGGMATTAQKNIERAKLEELMRTEAFYVQLTTKNDLATLLSSGFEAVGGRSPSEPLPAPSILQIENTETTRLTLKVTPLPNARAYEVRKMNGTGGWVPATIGTKSRKLEVDGLVPGSTYQLQVRAIGGSTGTGPWSNPVEHMAT
jgi:hypothetical protein